MVRLVARSLIPLGDACLLVGRPDEALDVARRALTMSDVLGHRVFAPGAWRMLGDALPQVEPADTGGAERAYRRSLALAEAMEVRPTQARCRLGLGKLYRRTGRLDEARAELQTAVAMLREMGMAFWLPEAEGELVEADG
jgi:tetratricopeptide (TPR) repeat protein